MSNVECRMECGMWNVECGMWNVECGMWNVECGMWNVEYEGCPASNLLMSVLMAGHTTHTVKMCNLPTKSPLSAPLTFFILTALEGADTLDTRMWNVECEGCPASSLLMSVLMAGHTLHTVTMCNLPTKRPLTAPLTFFTLTALEGADTRHSNARTHVGLRGCNIATTLVSVLMAGHTIHTAENKLHSHHSQFYSCYFPCSMEPILFSVCGVAPRRGRWNGMPGRWSLLSGTRCMWHVALMWNVACGMWHVACGMCHVPCDLSSTHILYSVPRAACSAFRVRGSGRPTRGTSLGEEQVSRIVSCGATLCCSQYLFDVQPLEQISQFRVTTGKAHKRNTQIIHTLLL
jgi:hypothetical protein